MKPKVLIVDDEQGMIDFLEVMFESDDFEVFTCTNGAQALEVVKREHPQLMICDINMKPMDGLAVLKQSKAISPDIVVIMVTAYASIEVAVGAMKSGAYDYIVKPFKINEMRTIVAKAMEKKNLEQENVYLKKQLREKFGLEHIIGKSQAMVDIFEDINKMGHTKASVLITGESGTGKELLARAIHMQSPVSEGKFVAINCSSMPEHLLESELFGHVKGAFTGAHKDKAGLIEEANGGTFFLDEIGDMDVSLQAKMLRVLQEKELRRVGGNETVSIDVRVIAATNKDLLKEVGKGCFREDLYYRLNVMPVTLPALRERRDDIPLLVEHFLRKYTPQGQSKFIAEDAMKVLIAYDWPGNVRELENTIERALVLSGAEDVRLVDLPSSFQGKELGEANVSEDDEQSLKERLEGMEKSIIEQALKNCANNQYQAARKLGLTRQSLQYKLKKFGLK